MLKVLLLSYLFRMENLDTPRKKILRMKVTSLGTLTLKEE